MVDRKSNGHRQLTSHVGGEHAAQSLLAPHVYERQQNSSRTPTKMNKKEAKGLERGQTVRLGRSGTTIDVVVHPDHVEPTRIEIETDVGTRDVNAVLVETVDVERILDVPRRSLYTRWPTPHRPGLTPRHRECRKPGGPYWAVVEALS